MTKQRTYQDIKEAVQKYQDRLSRLYVWLLPEEKEYIKKQAAGEEISVSEYVRRKVIPNSVRNNIEQDNAVSKEK